MKNGKIMMNAGFYKNNLNTSEQVGRCLIDNGIKLFGFCSFSDILPLLECRAKSRIPNNAKTVIMCAFPYLVTEKNNSKRNLSYYACVKDYHILTKNILANICTALRTIFKTNVFEWFSDNSPIREVKAGVMAGIGVLGDNGLLISKKYGSYVFLGEIVTDLELKTEKSNGGCLHCGLCKKNCPSKALNNHSINNETCLSSITQKKKPLNEFEENLIKESGIAWGCDECQLSCPMNKNVSQTPIKEFIDSAEHFITADEVPLKISERAYAWRGEKTITRNLNLLEN